MNPAADCRAFRARLELRLAGRVEIQGLSELSWHEHLFGCADCRALLEREEALEVLLASLPEPRLPQDLARRVLARLRLADEAELDTLLELDATPAAPEDLARRVLAALAGERSSAAVPAALDEAQLDGYLTRFVVPGPPADLAQRTLAALAGERQRERDLARLEPLLERAGAVEVPTELAERILAGLEAHRGRPVLRASFVRRRWIAAAAALLVAAGSWAWIQRSEGPARVPFEPTPPGEGPLVQAPDAPEDEEVAALEPDPELLALFDLLTADLLWEDGANLDLAASISIAGREELLLEFGQAPAAPEPRTEEDEG